MIPSIFVGGAWRGGAQAHEVRNPADTDQVVAALTLAGPADVTAAVDAAVGAAPPWRDTSAAERAAVLHRAADELEREGQTLARDLVREEGKTLAEATGEVRRSAATFRYFAGQALQPQGDVLPPRRPGHLALTQRLPVGPTVLITPFNYPLLLPAWKLAPALAYGNTVVWKPSELVPVSAVHLARALERAGLPPGVLNLVPARGAAVADALLGDARVRAVSFTGSTAVGRAVRQRVADRNVKVQLELGGKNAAVVLDDADVDRLAPTLAAGAMSGTGQKCTAISRIIADRRIAAELTTALAAELAHWRPGDGLDPSARMGPLVTAEAAERVLRAVAAARDDGAVVVSGGGRSHADGCGRGHFVDPALLADVAPTAPIAQEEVFGPVVAVIPVGGDDAAVAAANGTPYGLNAALFTRDLERALTVADRLECGMVHVNATGGFPPYAPFGGVKDSGFGPREQGPTAAEFFTELRVLNVHPAP